MGIYTVIPAAINGKLRNAPTPGYNRNKEYPCKENPCMQQRSAFSDVAAVQWSPPALLPSAREHLAEMMS